MLRLSPSVLALPTSRGFLPRHRPPPSRNSDGLPYSLGDPCSQAVRDHLCSMEESPALPTESGPPPPLFTYPALQDRAARAGNVIRPCHLNWDTSLQ